MTVFLFIVLALIIVVGGFFGGGRALASRHTIKTYGIKPKEYNALSDPAHYIMEEWQKTPASNRPQGNMHGVMTALDKKFGGIEKVNNHFGKGSFNRRTYETTYEFDWNNHGCHRDECKMQEYRSIMAGLQAVNKALGEQVYALEMAGIAGQLEQAHSMIDQLKEERNLIRTVTKELSP